jgi:hypothetical protein
MGKLIKEGLRPSTEGIENDSLVLLMHECWSSEANDRPEFSEVIARLERMYFEETNKTFDRKQIDIEVESLKNEEEGRREEKETPLTGKFRLSINEGGYELSTLV